MTQRVSNGLLLSLQGQNLLYIQAFDEKKKQDLSSILEKEKWKSSNLDLDIILKRVKTIPNLMEAFQIQEKEQPECDMVKYIS